MLVYHVMPNTCSVFGCKSNYRGHRSATVFKLPSASCDLKDKWIRVHRDMARVSSRRMRRAWRRVYLKEFFSRRA